MKRILLVLLLAGCTHIQELPVFPQCKILRINLPLSLIVNREYAVTCWVNDAPDSVILSIAYIDPASRKSVFFFRNGWQVENPENAPIVGPTWYFTPIYEVTFLFVFEAKNRWTSDTQKLFASAVDWTQPHGIPGPLD